MYTGSNQGTMFRRENGVWFGNYTRNGKRVRVSLGTTDKRIASQRLQELLTAPSDRSVLFSQVIDETLEDMRMRRLKSLQVCIYHSKAVRKALGSYKIGDITEKVIRDFTRKSLSEGIKNATVNRRLHIISQCLKIARSNGYISFIPHIQRLSESGNARQGFFTDSEIQRLLPHLPEYLKDFTLFAYLTGWRKSEISSLQWSMVNWETKVLLLPTSKNAEPRILPLVGSVLTLMERKWEQKEGSEFIFHYENGRPIGSIEHSWRTACRRAGMCDKLFHDLRRSACKNAIGAGLSERITMALCGHKTNHMLYRYHIVAERDLRAALMSVSQKCPTIPEKKEVSLQVVDNTLRRRIGAGVPPGLQIQ